jgi:putative membrane protein
MKRKLIMQIAVVTLISLIPAFYAFIFLYAYWDPTSHLSDISVAVVNNDIGAVIDSENKNIGNSLVDKLKSNSDVKWVFTDKKNADNGVLTEKYYAELVIPDDFSKCISTAAKANKTQGTLYFKSNDKLGTFASSLMSSVSANIENTVSKNITESLVDSLTGKLQELPDSLQKLSDGLSKLDSGAEQLSQGMNTLMQGQSLFNSGLNKMSEGLGSAGNGSQTLNSALQLLLGKSTLFANALNENTHSLQTLSNYSGQYNSGLNTISSKLNTYIDTSSKELQQSIMIITWLKAYFAMHPESMTDSNMHQIISALSSISESQNNTTDPSAAASALTSALNKLNQTYAQINMAVQKLPGGMQTASDGAGTLTGAIGQLSDGSTSLSSGIGTLKEGGDTLNEKSQIILSSDQKVLSGINQLRTGIEQMKASVDSSIQQLKSSSSALEGYGKFAANPVKMEATKIGDAKNTGMAMTPFMISLCLWLGGLMFIIIFTTMEKVKIEEVKWPQKTLIDFGLFRFQLIAVIPSVCLAFTILNILGLQVDNVAQFYGICILGGVTFITIIQVLVLVFQDLGKLLSIIFMLLQLTAGGGMMSMELVPSFYKAIHPYMPMTYTINALRDNILSMDTSDYNHSISVLVITLITGLFMTALLSLLTHLIREKKRRKKQEVITSMANTSD